MDFEAKWDGTNREGQLAYCSFNHDNYCPNAMKLIVEDIIGQLGEYYDIALHVKVAASPRSIVGAFDVVFPYQKLKDLTSCPMIMHLLELDTRFQVIEPEQLSIIFYYRQKDTKRTRDNDYPDLQSKRFCV